MTILKYNVFLSNNLIFPYVTNDTKKEIKLIKNTILQVLYIYIYTIKQRFPFFHLFLFPTLHSNSFSLHLRIFKRPSVSIASKRARTPRTIDRFDRVENSNDRRRVARASPRLHKSNPRRDRIRYVHQRKQDTWRVSRGIAGFSTKLWSRSVCAAPRPWLHNNEEDSGNCFYVSGIAEGATMVREAAYLYPFTGPRRWRRRRR